jgi:uncharacterized protein
MNLQIRFDRRKLAALCRKHHIRRLAFFGSVLGRDFRPDSDIDALVEFEPGQVIGFRIFRVEEELSHLLGGHPVDLVNPKYLNPRLKDQILASARVQYAEK